MLLTVEIDDGVRISSQLALDASSRQGAPDSLEPSIFGINATEERANFNAMLPAERNRFRHPKSPHDSRHGVINRRPFACAIGKDALLARAFAAVHFEIPHGFLFAQNREQRFAFSQSGLAPRAPI